ncbi:hypothetical protein R1sor_013592 [Riccia sorocarpa]|uniref:Thioredoxin domain-containing protein n=1 Tax=Riccia sorocarpa TaxID=122646 RepID=A0ABD3H740_9MARC
MTHQNLIGGARGTDTDYPATSATAARGVILRVIRRSVSHIKCNVAVCHFGASCSGSLSAENKDLQTPGPSIPSFYPANTVINSSISFAVPLVRLFSSSSAGASSKVVFVSDDFHFQQAIKQVEGTFALLAACFAVDLIDDCAHVAGKQIAPYIDQLSQEFDDVTFLKVDVDNLKLEETMEESGIGVVPTFQFHKGGKLIGELTGAVKDKLKSLVTALR